MSKARSWEGHAGEVLASIEENEVIDCVECGFAHVVPLPEEKTVEQFYTEEFYDDLKKDYISRHKEDLEWWKIDFREKYSFMEEHLGEKNPSLLDIGSGPGFFLQEGRERGWKVTGLEPGALPFKHSTEELGLDIYQELFSESTCRKYGKFHAVHMNNVMEHIINPHKTMGLINDILHPGGILCITVPNEFNPLQEILTKHFDKPQWWIDHREHLNYFNPSSLVHLFESNRFKVMKRSASFPLELFYLMGHEYIGNPTEGRKIHQKRKNLEISLDRAGRNDFKESLYASFLDQNLGREITVYGQKPFE